MNNQSLIPSCYLQTSMSQYRQKTTALVDHIVLKNRKLLSTGKIPWLQVDHIVLKNRKLLITGKIPRLRQTILSRKIENYLVQAKYHGLGRPYCPEKQKITQYRQNTTAQVDHIVLKNRKLLSTGKIPRLRQTILS